VYNFVFVHAAFMRIKLMMMMMMIKDRGIVRAAAVVGVRISSWTRQSISREFVDGRHQQTIGPRRTAAP